MGMFSLDVTSNFKYQRQVRTFANNRGYPHGNNSTVVGSELKNYEPCLVRQEGSTNRDNSS